MDLGLVADGFGVGTAFDLSASMTEALSAYARAEAMWYWDAQDWTVGAHAGLRLKW